MNLNITDLSKKLGGKPIICEITAEFQAKVVGLLGANGAGKTTLLRCMTGMYALDSGTIHYDGLLIDRSRSYRQHLGYLPQAFGLFRELTVLELMEYFCALKKVPREKRANSISYCLEQVNMADRMRSRVSTLSGGMIRRVGIAQAFLGDTKVVLLDEPTSGLDPQERMRFKNMILSQKGSDRLVLLSTHIIEDVENLCDEVLVMDEGKIVFNGSSDALRKKAQGRVYAVKEEEISTVEGPFHDAKLEQRGGSIIHRVICQQEQRFSALEGTLEDGFVAVTRMRS